MKHFSLFLIAILFACTSAAVCAVSSAENLRANAASVYNELQALADDESQPLDLRVDALQRISSDTPPSSLLQLLEETNPEAARNLYGSYLLQRFLYDDYVSQFAINWESRTVPPHYFDWLFLTENLPEVQELTEAVTAEDSDDALFLLQKGRLQFSLLQREDAAALFDKALASSPDALVHREAIIGLSKVYSKNRDYQRALDSLTTLVDVSTLNADVLFEMGLALVYLGRTSEAIDMFEEAVRWDPLHRMANYFLGNGYARENYTQLWDRVDVDCGGADVHALLNVELLIESGDMQGAKSELQQFLSSYPECPRALVMLGSVDWNLGDYWQAAVEFRKALDVVPEYGRAHNGLARSLLSFQMTYSINRDSDDAIFDAKPTPEIPGIEKFISNWASLTPRHKKQVALSVEPWKAYLPVLIECGSHHYIKPLHQMLSECPNMEVIADQRISYDSRLWDDVRGCGGYNTVTGIEDVERSIYFAYNTVLHELTHQVHYVFPPADTKHIEDIFYAADAREESGSPTYMNRYQASSVYEYLAEGANAIFSPRRDAYDTREIVRERLYEMDPELVKLVEYYLPAPNLEACYPVGLVAAAADALENRKMDLAMTYARRAEERDPNSEDVLSELSRIFAIRDEDEQAVKYADKLITHYPQKANSYSYRSSAEFTSTGNAANMLELLSGGLTAVDATERLDLLQSLGNISIYAGRYADAATYFKEILAEKENDDAALQGYAEALSGLRQYAEADSVFKKAVQRRSGVADLRLSYAQMLIESGQLDAARTQIEEAALLNPEYGAVYAYQGWLELASDNNDEALTALQKAVVADDHDYFYDVLLLKAMLAAGDKEASQFQAQLLKQKQTSIPEWYYDTSRAGYSIRHTWPDYAVKMLDTL